MRTVKVKAYAKVNLTLDILGIENGFHTLNSLVSTIDLYDVVKVKKRKDDKILLKTYGISTECDVEKNTAYKAGKLFKETFNTSGVTIIIDKRIPLGGGLGGSSADIAGVLLAMKKLFEIDKDVKPLADSLGSDAGFMLTGGYAKMQGRGDVVTSIDCDKVLYFLVMPAKSIVTAKASYTEYDKIGEKYLPVTDKAIDYLKKGEMQAFIKTCKNDLYNASANLCPEIERNIEFLSKYSKAIMTGSGSCSIAIFEDKKERDRIFMKVLGYGLNVLRTKTHLPK